MLEPKKPESFDGRCDYLMVNTWLYKMEQYLVLLQLFNPVTPLSDNNKMTYAAMFFSSTAAISWYTVVQANKVPITLNGFRKLVVAEFVPIDHVCRARDKLRRLRQTSVVSKYLAASLIWL